MGVTGKKKLLTKLRAEGRSTKREIKEQIKSSNFWLVLMNTVALIAFYYASSIGLTFYQSWLMKELKFPLTIVLCHFVMKFILSAACRAAYTLHTGLDRVTLGWAPMLGRVGLVALVASLDIGLSQWSFQYIDVALYTITKSTSIVFILMWAILLRLEKKHWSLVVIVFMISSGLAMFTYKSTDFVLIGFVMVLSASFLSGIRWTLSQLIMQRAQYNLGNPLDMIYHVQPLMVLALLPFAVTIEGSRVASSVSLARYASLADLLRTVSLIGVGGIIAFGMEVAEFLLVSYTSSLTLSVAGIVKEIISLTIAIIFQSTGISFINAVGLVVCMAGIVLHVVQKARKPEVEAVGRPGREARSPGSGEALLTQSDSDSSGEVYHTSSSNYRSSISGRPASEDPRGRRARSLAEEPVFLRDHRQWTSVRDSHIEHAARPPGVALPGPATGIGNENCEVAIEDIVDFSVDEPVDALEEADQLLEQLDLLSSD